MFQMDEEKKRILDELFDHFQKDTVKRCELIEHYRDREKEYPHWIRELTVKWGHYKIHDYENINEPKNEVAPINPIKTAEIIPSYIPKTNINYVQNPIFNDICKILKFNSFYPIFITGPTRCGKTEAVEQACSKENKGLIRVNITAETDEDDLLGGFRLINGNTEFHYGPVVEAMKNNCILLLDEIDLASNRIMCLQPILEGKGVFLKKINEYVEPTPGFNIIATANTKGKGDDDGRYMFTNILNESFLERFGITLEFDYLTASYEKKILNKLMINPDENFIENIVEWAGNIRKSFKDGAVDDVISTGRLIHIVKAFEIFDDKKKSLELCLARFEHNVKDSFIELFDKMSPFDGTQAIEEDETTNLNLQDIIVKEIKKFDVGFDPNTELINKINDLIIEGRKIQAIKEIREFTNVGLKEAKYAVDHIIENFKKAGVQIL